MTTLHNSGDYSDLVSTTLQTLVARKQWRDSCLVCIVLPTPW